MRRELPSVIPIMGFCSCFVYLFVLHLFTVEAEVCSSVNRSTEGKK